MKPRTSPKTDGSPPRLRRRFGYDRRWWGKEATVEAEADAYWPSTRRALTSLMFVLPLLLIYEAAIVRVGPAGGGLRGAADGWIGAAFRAIGLVDPWWPPIALVFALLGRHALERQPWQFRGRHLLGMVGECAVLAVVLIGLGKLVDLGFHRIDLLPTLAEPAADPALPAVVEYVGVGLYEELLFRLALIPLIFGALRLVRAPRVVAMTLALTGAALLFSLAHHLGTPGEAFSWFAFVFRWSAGIYFGWIFCERGYGVAVGTHAAYDILVGCFGLQF